MKKQFLANRMTDKVHQLAGADKLAQRRADVVIAAKILDIRARKYASVEDVFSGPARLMSYPRDLFNE